LRAKRGGGPKRGEGYSGDEMSFPYK